jgi:hypothetical protein
MSTYMSSAMMKTMFGGRPDAERQLVAETTMRTARARCRTAVRVWRAGEFTGSAVVAPLFGYGAPVI